MVPRGLVPTPFDARTAPFNLSRAWQPWAGYATADHFELVEAEYFAIRNQATLFDVSAMRKFRVRGPDAERVMNRLVTRDLRKLRPGPCRLRLVVRRGRDGDRRRHRLSPRRRQISGCAARSRSMAGCMDVAWGFDVAIEDESEAVAGLSLQGPTSFAVLEAAGLGGAAGLKPFDLAEHRRHPDLAHRLHRRSRLRAVGAARARTRLWDRLWDAGRLHGLRPIGYAALDLARLEAGFILSGRDYVSIHHAARPTRGRTPFELGYGALVDFDKGHFNGRRALLRHAGERAALHAGRIRRRGRQARAMNALVYHRRKTEIGHVTSRRLVADLQAQPRAGDAEGALRREHDVRSLGRDLSRQGGQMGADHDRRAHRLAAVLPPSAPQRHATGEV